MGINKLLSKILPPINRLIPKRIAQTIWREKKPRYYIFLIHGFSGNMSNFGHMRQALLRNLPRHCSDYSYFVKPFEYDTGNDNKTPTDFAYDFATFINNFLTGRRKITAMDKISVIMHSQGGIIGSIWLYNSLEKKAGYGHPLVDNIDAFITMATPFWGSKIAQFGTSFRQLWDKISNKHDFPLGRNELRELSFGSDTIYLLRQKLIIRNHRALEYIKKHIRFLNISAIANVMDPFKSFGGGNKKYEDDTAVPLPSSRFNCFFNQSFKKHYECNEREKFPAGNHITLAKEVIVNALHLTYAQENETIPGIVQIPKKNIKNPYHSHPSFHYVFEHLLGKTIVQKDLKVINDLSSFLLDINVTVPDKQLVHAKEFIIEFFNQDGSPINKHEVTFSSFLELYSRGEKTSMLFPEQHRFYFTGNLLDSDEQDELGLPEKIILVKIYTKHLRSRMIEIKIKAACSSFIDINLISDEK